MFFFNFGNEGEKYTRESERQSQKQQCTIRWAQQKLCELCPAAAVHMNAEIHSDEALNATCIHQTHSIRVQWK